MTRPKVGDRVHVEFDAEVQSVDRDGQLRLNDGHPGEPVQFIHPRHCTVIVPPIAVGDVVDTAEKAERLPHGSIVARAGSSGLACQLTRRGWEIVGVDWDDVDRLNIARPPVYDDAIVLRIGGGA